MNDTGFKLGVQVRPCLLAVPIALSRQWVSWHREGKAICISPQELQDAL